MKKLLACILTAMLLFAVAAVPAAACQPPNLLEPLPPVASIDVTWSGEVFLLSSTDFMLWLCPRSNLDVTLHFENGESLQLESGHEQAIGGWWYAVRHVLNPEAGTVTLYYVTSDDQRAFTAEHGLRNCCCEVRSHALYRAFIASLPHATIDFPANYVALFIEQHRPVSALTLNRAAAIPAGTGWHIVSFTPQASGQYRFFLSGTQWRMHLVGADLRVHATNNRIGLVAPLEAGQTYYLLVVRSGDNNNIELTVARHGLWARIWAWVLARIDWLRSTFGL